MRASAGWGALVVATTLASVAYAGHASKADGVQVARAVEPSGDVPYDPTGRRDPCGFCSSATGWWRRVPGQQLLPSPFLAKPATVGSPV